MSILLVLRHEVFLLIIVSSVVNWDFFFFFFLEPLVGILQYGPLLVISLLQ